MRGAGSVIKIQDARKLNSRKSAEIPKKLQEKPGPREILVVQFSRRAVENSKVSRCRPQLSAICATRIDKLESINVLASDPMKGGLPARHRARCSAGSPRTRHARDRLLELRPEERHAHVRGARGFVRVRLYFDLDSRSAGSMPCEDAACVASSASGVLREHISRFIIPGRFLVSRSV